MAQREFALPDKRPPPNFVEAFRDARSTVTTFQYIKRNTRLEKEKKKKGTRNI